MRLVIPGSGRLNATTCQPGRAEVIAEDILGKRQAGQANRMGQFLTEALGTPDIAKQRIARLTADRNAIADNAFAAARADAAPVDVRGVLGVIDDKLGQMPNVSIKGDGIDNALASFRKRLVSSSPVTDQLGGTSMAPAGADSAPTAV